jgi:hypothetical protein
MELDFQESVSIWETLSGKLIEPKMTSSKEGVRHDVHENEEESHGSQEV